MKLGIKVGLKNQSLPDLLATNAQACEVWYDATRANEYENLFQEINKLNIDTGLHFWGALTDDTWTNLAYPDADLIKKTRELMQNTIDQAASHGFKYVNIHPGCRARVSIDYEREFFQLQSLPVDLEKSQNLFLENAQALNKYALNRGVIFTVETVPLRVTCGWYKAEARANPANIYELPVSVVRKAARMGLAVANDFSHTAANVITDNPDQVWDFLNETTRDLAPFTRLIHLGFLMPPYNGTDNHDSLDNPMLDTAAAVPNRQQIIALLRMFKNRDDVYIITEPKADHVRNYFLARQLLHGAGI